MATTIPSTALVPTAPVITNMERLALAGFLAGYSGLTRQAYELDLRQFASWCQQHQLRLFQARCADIEFFTRDLEARSRARATITRRLCTVAGSGTRLGGCEHGFCCLPVTGRFAARDGTRLPGTGGPAGLLTGCRLRCRSARARRRAAATRRQARDKCRAEFHAGEAPPEGKGGATSADTSQSDKNP
jgi:hypothetical protein